MFPQDLALDGGEENFHEELSPKEFEKPEQTLKNEIEPSTLGALDDDVVNGN